MRKKRQFAILEQSNFGATASTASTPGSGLGGLMGVGSAAPDRIVTRSQLGSLAGAAAEQAQAPQRARRGSAPAGALPKVPEVSVSVAATPRESSQRDTDFSARSALAAAMSKKIATDSAADSAAPAAAVQPKPKPSGRVLPSPAMKLVVDALKQQLSSSVSAAAAAAKPRVSPLAVALGENVADANVPENVLVARSGPKTKAASSAGPKAQPTPKQLNRARRGSAKASSVPAKGSEGLGLLGLF